MVVFIFSVVWSIGWFGYRTLSHLLRVHNNEYYYATEEFVDDLVEFMFWPVFGLARTLHYGLKRADVVARTLAYSWREIK